jgi:hypothetical protein
MALSRRILFLLEVLDVFHCSSGHAKLGWRWQTQRSLDAALTPLTASAFFGYRARWVEDGRDVLVQRSMKSCPIDLRAMTWPLPDDIPSVPGMRGTTRHFSRRLGDSTSKVTSFDPG